MLNCSCKFEVLSKTSKLLSQYTTASDDYQQRKSNDMITDQFLQPSFTEVGPAEKLHSGP